jgi:hypothetical protein
MFGHRDDDLKFDLEPLDNMRLAEHLLAEVQLKTMLLARELLKIVRTILIYEIEVKPFSLTVSSWKSLAT